MTRTVFLDRDGLALDGTPLYLLAGQVHYFRYPRAEWRDLLLKAKAGGLNTIDTVIPWNTHEPFEGQFDWSEEADLPGYLDLCAELGLWAIVRPGPYICAEWENGGFPAWFTAKPGIELRLDNPVFMEHTLRWFDALFPILAPRQVQNGGAVILCQIENEHWASGRYGHDEHQQTLAEAALARGMLVPQYTCMGATRGYAEFRNGWSGIAEKLAQTRALWPENPMIVSELWSGWFDNWGASRHTHKTAARLDTILHQLTAIGASGFSHWMWAGGTNFGFWGGRTVGGDTVYMTTSYDYDAPVSEYGGLTEKFYAARRHHLFLQTLGGPLSRALADAVAGGPRVIAPAAVAGRGEAGNAPYRNVRAGASAALEWHDFTATFLQNTIPEGLTYQLFVQHPARHLVVEVEANAIKPVFTNLPLTTKDEGRRTNDDQKGLQTQHSALSTWHLKLAYHTSRILGFWRGAACDTLVMYGFAGEVGELGIALEAGDEREARLVVDEATLPGNVVLSEQPPAISLRYWISDRPTVVRAQSDERVLNIVLLTTERAERFWPLSDGRFVCGPDLVIEDGGPWTVDGGPKAGIWPFYTLDPDGRLNVLQFPRPDQPVTSAVFQLAWSAHGVVERSAGEGWRALEGLQTMEGLDCPYGYGWYCTEFEAATDTTLALVAPGLNDRARVIVDGEDRGWLGVHPQGPRMAIELPVVAGKHDLRLLVDNLGRFNYGSNTGEQKGLLDNLYAGHQHDITCGWSALWQEAVFAGEAVANAKPWAIKADAEGVDLANFAFQGPSVWLLRAFEALEGWRYVLHLTGDRNSGALYVNGQNVARFSRHYGGGFLRADISELARPGTNVLALNIQNYAGMPYRAHLLEYDPQQPLGGRWNFRPGVTVSSAENAEDVEALNVNTSARSASSAVTTSGPVFFRATFEYDPETHGMGPFKLHPAGLRKGQIWLNGRNVGRYWQLGPQEAYKLPVSWLAARNELLIFEEEGGDPREVWIGTA